MNETPVNELTIEELRLCKLAVIRALDTIRPKETQLAGELEALYKRLRELGA